MLASTPATTALMVSARHRTGQAPPTGMDNRALVPAESTGPIGEPLAMTLRFAVTTTVGSTTSVPGLGCLTTQERNCAVAVAEGMTNRQVATALCISPKTVEYHLSKIYAKLGITSRCHLTRIVTTAQLV